MSKIVADQIESPTTGRLLNTDRALESVAWVAGSQSRNSQLWYNFQGSFYFFPTATSTNPVLLLGSPADNLAADIAANETTIKPITSATNPDIELQGIPYINPPLQAGETWAAEVYAPVIGDPYLALVRKPLVANDISTMPVRYVHEFNVGSVGSDEVVSIPPLHLPERFEMQFKLFLPDTTSEQYVYGDWHNTAENKRSVLIRVIAGRVEVHFSSNGTASTGFAVRIPVDAFTWTAFKLIKNGTAISLVSTEEVETTGVTPLNIHKSGKPVSIGAKYFDGTFPMKPGAMISDFVIWKGSSTAGNTVMLDLRLDTNTEIVPDYSVPLGTDLYDFDSLAAAAEFNFVKTPTGLGFTTDTVGAAIGESSQRFSLPLTTVAGTQYLVKYVLKVAGDVGNTLTATEGLLGTGTSLKSITNLGTEGYLYFTATGVQSSLMFDSNVDNLDTTFESLSIQSANCWGYINNFDIGSHRRYTKRLDGQYESDDMVPAISTTNQVAGFATYDAPTRVVTSTDNSTLRLLWPEYTFQSGLDYSLSITADNTIGINVNGSTETTVVTDIEQIITQVNDDADANIYRYVEVVVANGNTLSTLNHIKKLISLPSFDAAASGATGSGEGGILVFNYRTSATASDAFDLADIETNKTTQFAAPTDRAQDIVINTTASLADMIKVNQIYIVSTSVDSGGSFTAGTGVTLTGLNTLTGIGTIIAIRTGVDSWHCTISAPDVVVGDVDPSIIEFKFDRLVTGSTTNKDAAIANSVRGTVGSAESFGAVWDAPLLIESIAEFTCPWSGSADETFIVNVAKGIPSDINFSGTAVDHVAVIFSAGNLTTDSQGTGGVNTTVRAGIPTGDVVFMIERDAGNEIFVHHNGIRTLIYTDLSITDEIIIGMGVLATGAVTEMSMTADPTPLVPPQATTGTIQLSAALTANGTTPVGYIRGSVIVGQLVNETAAGEELFKSDETGITYKGKSLFAVELNQYFLDNTSSSLVMEPANASKSFEILNLPRVNSVHSWRVQFSNDINFATPATPTGGTITIESANLLDPSPQYSAVNNGVFNAVDVYTAREIPSAILQVAATRVTFNLVTGATYARVQYEANQMLGSDLLESPLRVKLKTILTSANQVIPVPASVMVEVYHYQAGIPVLQDEPTLERDGTTNKITSVAVAGSAIGETVLIYHHVAKADIQTLGIPELTQANIDNGDDIAGIVNPSKVSFGSGPTIVKDWTTLTDVSVDTDLLAGLTLPDANGTMNGLRLEIKDLYIHEQTFSGAPFLGLIPTRAGVSTVGITNYDLRYTPVTSTGAVSSRVAGPADTANVILMGSFGAKSGNTVIDLISYAIRDGATLCESLGYTWRSNVVTNRTSTTEGSMVINEGIFHAFGEVVSVPEVLFTELWLKPRTSSGTAFTINNMKYRITYTL